MTPRRKDTELQHIRRVAEKTAAGRRETLTTAHLLAAMASESSSGADLLIERGLTPERLLLAARASSDDGSDALRIALDEAVNVAGRMGAREALAVHLLVALLSDRSSAAHRALDQCGIDVARLRVSAINLGLGLVGRRRITTRRESNRAAAEARGRQRAPGVKVPFMPPSAPPKAKPVSDGPSASRAPAPPPSEPEVEASSEPELAASPPPPPPKRAARPPLGRKKSSSSRFFLDPRTYPMISALGRNLTLEAEAGELDPVVGRDLEVEQTLDVLAKRQGNNPCLVGAAGVGKTAVVRALALQIATGEDVGPLDDRVVIEIPVSELVAGTGVRGALAQRLGAIRKEVLKSKGRIVLFFDEIHQLFTGDGSDEMSGELKVALAKGELPCIGATTFDEYRRAIESDPALARRFTVVEVPELGREDAFLVLDALSESFAKHHGVEFSEEALASSIAWSVRYLPDRALPDKAISVVDLAGARVRRRGGRMVSPENVAEVVAELVDMPMERLLETDRERMLRLEELLAERVIGHEEHLRSIARILRRNAAGLGSRRPIGTFLLLGPTGVGKTETAKAIAEALFFTERAMTRVDLSEYGESHSSARLIGSPPGYVGHESGGQLTEAVRRRPYQVILLDEIEKAHPEVLETFLAVFDEGRLTDGRGRTVDFTSTVILLTSNLGAKETGTVKRRVGFGADQQGSAQEIEDAVTAAARKALAPELYNRLDEVLVFRPLERSDVRRIARKMLDGIGTHLEIERSVRLEYDADVIELLLDRGGFDPSLGARPMKRTLARLVEAPLAEALLRGDLSTGDVAQLTARDGELDVAARGSSSITAAE